MSVTTPLLAKARQAKSARELWTSMNSDQYFDFMTLFHSATNARLGAVGEGNVDRSVIGAGLDAIEEALAAFNAILASGKGKAEGNAVRCQVLHKAIRGNGDLEWTPFQRILMDLCQRGRAHFVKPSGVGDDSERAFVIFPEFDTSFQASGGPLRDAKTEELYRHLTEGPSEWFTKAEKEVERSDAERLAVTARALSGLATSSVEEAVVQCLAYRDMGGISASRAQTLARDTLDLPNSRAYAMALRALVAKHGVNNVSKAAREAMGRCHRVLYLASIPLSEWSHSHSWALWDLGKQFYFVQHRAEAHPDYVIADPLLDSAKLQEISDRHVGWEVYQRRDNPGPKIEALDTWADIKELLRLPPNEAHSLRSRDLARLGSFVRIGLKSAL